MAGNPDNPEVSGLIKLSLRARARNLYIQRCKVLEWWGRSLATTRQTTSRWKGMTTGSRIRIDGFADQKAGMKSFWSEERNP
jgi:hypothetical protein